ncbi:MAG TPA: hypothetical protein VFA11_18140 [Acidimicrobiales bacterium]|nr:hypothetical protein [Acidimicrobiales bacterium]
MNETKWERYGASAGIAFVVLLLVSVFIAPMPPHLNASTAKITSYFSDHRRALVTSTLLASFASLVFLWFVAHLRHVLQRAEGGAEALSPAVFGSGISVATVGIISALPTATLALMAGRPGDPASAATVRMMFDLNFVTQALLALAAGLFVVTGSMAMVRKEMVSPNLGWLGILVGALLWISGSASLYLTTYSRVVDVVGLVGLLGFALWMLLASGAMYQHPEIERAPSHAPTFA